MTLFSIYSWFTKHFSSKGNIALNSSDSSFLGTDNDIKFTLSLQKVIHNITFWQIPNFCSKKSR